MEQPAVAGEQPDGGALQIVASAAKEGVLVTSQASNDLELIQLWLGRYRSANTRRGYEIDLDSVRARGGISLMAAV